MSGLSPWLHAFCLRTFPLIHVLRALVIVIPPMIISCSTVIETNNDPQPLTGSWFGYSVTNCPDTITRTEMDTIVFAFHFDRSDSGSYIGYFGTDLTYPMVRGKVTRNATGDSLSLEHFPLQMNIVNMSMDQLRLRWGNTKNGCEGEFVMVPLVDTQLPEIR